MHIKIAGLPQNVWYLCILNKYCAMSERKSLVAHVFSFTHLQTINYITLN